MGGAHTGMMTTGTSGFAERGMDGYGHGAGGMPSSFMTNDESGSEMDEDEMMKGLNRLQSVKRHSI